MTNPRPVVTVDASLAVKWILPEDDTDLALALIEEWAATAVQPIAPGWFACEVANVLFQRIRAGEMSLSDARAQLRTLLAVVDLRDEDPSDAERAMEIALLAGRQATYDAQYAALAERLGCELWTADDRFRDAAIGVFPRVRSLTEFRPGRR